MLKIKIKMQRFITKCVKFNVKVKLQIIGKTSEPEESSDDRRNDVGKTS